MQSFLHGVAEYLTPVLTNESQFKERGVLTPEQFVQAGDQLTFKCPTWQWYVRTWLYTRSARVGREALWRLGGLRAHTPATSWLCHVVRDRVFVCSCCPRSSGDPSTAKPFLPPDKQLLVTRNGA